MVIKQNWKPVKLKAVDDQDLQVFSQFLFESIVLPSEINFEKKQQQFAMAIERFTWEHAEEESHLLMQVLSILIINYVEIVDLKNIFNNSQEFIRVGTVEIFEPNKGKLMKFGAVCDDDLISKYSSMANNLTNRGDNK